MSFTIVLNSANGTGNVYSKEYNIDWTATPAHSGKYKLNYTFCSSSIASITNTCILININLGTYDKYTASASNILISRSNSINVGYAFSMGSFMLADATAGLPVIIQRKPSNNTFTVYLTELDGDNYTELNSGSYTLHLFFEAV